MPHDERALIKQAQQGDTQAFEALARQHQGRLFRLVLAITGNREDAEDALQEVLIRAYRSLPAFRGDATVSTWLHRIALNTTRNWLRSQVRASSDRIAQRLAAVGAPATPDVDRELEDRERRAILREALQCLPAHYREALLLRHYQDMPYGEIAQVLQIPIGTVRSRIAQGRCLLLRKLAALGYP